MNLEVEEKNKCTVEHLQLHCFINLHGRVLINTDKSDKIVQHLANTVSTPSVVYCFRTWEPIETIIRIRLDWGSFPCGSAAQILRSPVFDKYLSINNLLSVL